MRTRALILSLIGLLALTSCTPQVDVPPEFHNPQLWEGYLQHEQPWDIPDYPVLAALVPHHKDLMPQIASFYRALAKKNQPDRIILWVKLGLEEFPGLDSVIADDVSFPMPWGEPWRPDPKAAEILKTHQFQGHTYTRNKKYILTSQGWSTHRGLLYHLPLLKKAFPQAGLIIVGHRGEYSFDFPFQDLITKNTLILASGNFSQGLSPQRAELNDRFLVSALDSGGLTRTPIPFGGAEDQGGLHNLTNLFYGKKWREEKGPVNSLGLDRLVLPDPLNPGGVTTHQFRVFQSNSQDLAPSSQRFGLLVLGINNSSSSYPDDYDLYQEFLKFPERIRQASFQGPQLRFLRMWDAILGHGSPKGRYYSGQIDFKHNIYDKPTTILRNVDPSDAPFLQIRTIIVERAQAHKLAEYWHSWETMLKNHYGIFIIRFSEKTYVALRHPHQGIEYWELDASNQVSHTLGVEWFREGFQSHPFDEGILRHTRPLAMPVDPLEKRTDAVIDAVRANRESPSLPLVSLTAFWNLSRTESVVGTQSGSIYLMESEQEGYKISEWLPTWFQWTGIGSVEGVWASVDETVWTAVSGKRAWVYLPLQPSAVRVYEFPFLLSHVLINREETLALVSSASEGLGLLDLNTLQWTEIPSLPPKTLLEVQKKYLGLGFEKSDIDQVLRRSNYNQTYGFIGNPATDLHDSFLSQIVKFPHLTWRPLGLGHYKMTISEKSNDRKYKGQSPITDFETVDILPQEEGWVTLESPPKEWSFEKTEGTDSRGTNASILIKRQGTESSWELILNIDRVIVQAFDPSSQRLWLTVSEIIDNDDVYSLMELDWTTGKTLRRWPLSYDDMVTFTLEGAKVSQDHRFLVTQKGSLPGQYIDFNDRNTWHPSGLFRLGEPPVAGILPQGGYWILDPQGRVVTVPPLPNRGIPTLSLVREPGGRMVAQMDENQQWYIREAYTGQELTLERAQKVLEQPRVPAPSEGRQPPKPVEPSVIRVPAP